MYQNVSNALKTLRKASFRNTIHFLPIMSHDGIFNLSIVYFFPNMVSVQGVVYSLVSQLLNMTLAWNMFKVNNKHLRTSSLTAFKPCCSVVSTVDFKQVNTGWITIINCPAGIHLFTVNIRNTKTRSEICSKLTIKIPERRQ